MVKGVFGSLTRMGMKGMRMGVNVNGNGNDMERGMEGMIYPPSGYEVPCQKTNC